MKIAYFIGIYPLLTETFILNEIIGFQLQNISGEIFCLYKNKSKILPSQIKKLTWRVQFFASKILVKRTFFSLMGAWTLLFFRQPKVAFCVLAELIKCKDINLMRLLIKSAPISLRLISGSFDVLYTHFGGQQAELVRVLSNITGIPYGFSFEEEEIFVSPSNIGNKIHQATFVFTRTKSIRNFLINTYNLCVSDKRKIHILYTVGVDTKLFKPRKVKGNRVFTIILVGRLEEMKGVHILLQACSRLRDTGLKFRCIIVGSGSWRSKLKTRINKLHLRSLVRLYGARNHDAVPYLLNTSNVFVLPSIIDRTGNRDAFPYAAQEAIASGLPVITSDISGVAEIAKKSPFMVLVEPGNIDQLAEKILFIAMLNRFSCMKFCKDNARFARERLSIEYNSQTIVRFMQNELRL